MPDEKACPTILARTFALLTRVVAAYKLRVSQPGQPAINAATRCCAVYGFPIRHSASPAMHNAAFAALGLNWRYLAFEVRPDDLRAAIAAPKRCSSPA